MPFYFATAFCKKIIFQIVSFDLNFKIRYIKHKGEQIMKLLKRLFGAKAQYLLLLTQEQQVKENSKRLGIQSLILSIVELF